MRPENIEFIALFKASQWSQAETARQLRTTPATISRYLSEDESKQIAPGQPVLELFKFLLAKDRPGALTAAGSVQERSIADWERNVIEDLRWLHQEDRERVLTAMRAIVAALPKREPVNYGKVPKTMQGVSSKIADVARSSQASASELARRELQEQQRKQATDATTEHKRGQGHGGRKGIKGKPESPSQAPK